MWKKQFCMNLFPGSDMPLEEQLELLKNTGFDGFFVTWDPRMDVESLAKKANALGMRFQSIHAPFGRSADMWHDDEQKAQQAVQELCDCVDACVRCGVALMIVHTFIGFEEHDPRPVGFSRFSQVVDHASERGVKIAFENTEGEEYLKALMDHFKGNDTVGFCWDTGHEMCYNHSQDLLALYGDRLLCTHLNDNLGIRDYEGVITWLDDLHLLPFDGVADWQDIAERLHKWNFRDILTFELNINSKPGRHENDCYGRMSFEDYVTEVYKRACRFGTLLNALEK